MRYVQSDCCTTEFGPKSLLTQTRFGGLLTTEFLEPPPGRCFLFRQTYRHNVEGPIPENLRKLINSPKKPKGPPAHLHRFQTEYFRVESGIMGICIDGKHMKFTPADGEFTVRAGIIHQFYIHPDSPEAMTIYISASDSGKDRELDRVFFENWYGYWHDALLQGKGLNLLQVLAVCSRYSPLGATSQLINKSDPRWR